MLSKSLMLSICLLIFVGLAANAQNKFVGAKKCESCHKPAGMAKDNSYAIWAKTSHAKAHEAKDANKPECTKCHAPVKDFAKEGVTCEACHGAGSKYAPMGPMKEIAKAESAKKNEVAKKYGLTLPGEKMCTGCHSQASVPKGHKEIKFNFTEANKKITHKKA